MKQEIKLTKKPEEEIILWEEMTERERMIYEAGEKNGAHAIGIIFTVVMVIIGLISLYGLFVKAHYQ